MSSRPSTRDLTGSRVRSIQTLETSESSEDEEEGVMMDGTNGSTGEPDSEFEPELEGESSEDGSGVESDAPSENRDSRPHAPPPARAAAQALSGSRVHPPLPMGRPVPAVRNLSAATAAARTLLPGDNLTPRPVLQRRRAPTATNEDQGVGECLPSSDMPSPPSKDPICATIVWAKRQRDRNVGAHNGIGPGFSANVQDVARNAAVTAPAGSAEAPAKRQRLEEGEEAARQVLQTYHQSSSLGVQAQAGIQQVCIWLIPPNTN